MLDFEFVDEVVDAIKELPIFQTLHKILPLLPKLQRLIARHDVALEAGNATPGTPITGREAIAAYGRRLAADAKVTRYTLPVGFSPATAAAHRARLVRYAMDARDRGDNDGFRRASEAIGAEMNSGKFGQAPSSPAVVKPNFITRQIGPTSEVKISAGHSRESIDKIVRKTLRLRAEGRQVEFRDVLNGEV